MVEGDLFDIAAGYCFHIAEAQAFFDGNKRTAVAAALTFLEINRVSTRTDSVRLYEAIIAVAEHRRARTVGTPKRPYRNRIKLFGLISAVVSR
jgi:death-on-curing protein